MFKCSVFLQHALSSWLGSYISHSSIFSSVWPQMQILERTFKLTIMRWRSHFSFRPNPCCPKTRVRHFSRLFTWTHYTYSVTLLFTKITQLWNVLHYPAGQFRILPQRWVVHIQQIHWALHSVRLCVPPTRISTKILIFLTRKPHNSFSNIISEH